MRTIAQPAATNPLHFGRRLPRAVAVRARQGLSDDLRLFAWTFAAGFMAVSIFLA
jgi:hypothetical protein